MRGRWLYRNELCRMFFLIGRSRFETRRNIGDRTYGLYFITRSRGALKLRAPFAIRNNPRPRAAPHGTDYCNRERPDRWRLPPIPANRTRARLFPRGAIR